MTEFDQTEEGASAPPEARCLVQCSPRSPPVQRKALEPAHLAGYTRVEISRLLGLPLLTAMTRITDGLTQLRDALPASTMEPT